MEPKMFIYQSGYASDFHLSGQHDQKTHGHGGSVVELRPIDKQGQAIAQKYHGDTTDKQGRNYVNGHLTQVGSSLPPELALAGWLHDTLEDTHATEESLTKDGVDPETIRIVKAVTLDGPVAGDNANKTYPEKMNDVIAAGPKAVRVKLSDLSSNSDPTRNKDGVPIKPKYLEAKEQLKSYLKEADPGLYQDYIDRIESKPGSFPWDKVPFGEVKWDTYHNGGD